MTTPSALQADIWRRIRAAVLDQIYLGEGYFRTPVVSEEEWAAAFAGPRAMVPGDIGLTTDWEDRGTRDNTALDPFYYARDHDAGPGAWCVRGPDGFRVTAPGLDKLQAYFVGKILSRDYKAVYAGLLDSAASIGLKK